MGLKQSSPAAGVRLRSYSDAVGGGSGRAAVLRYYAGSPAAQIGERIQYPSDTPHSFIPSSGRRTETDGQRALLIGSLPAHLSPHMLSGFHCPVCTKFVSSDEIDAHFLMCFSKPRLNYNEDVSSRDCGECSICLDDMLQGDTIARLPCLCVYHKGCIDEWFEVNRSCPEHPTD